MSQYTEVTITPNLGGVITLPMPESIETDQANNVTFAFADPLEDKRPALLPILGKQLLQQLTLSGAYVVVAQPGAQLCTVTWSEVDPWNANLRPYSATGVLSMPSYRHAREGESYTLVLYRAQRLVPRGGGAVQDA